MSRAKSQFGFITQSNNPAKQQHMNQHQSQRVENTASKENHRDREQVDVTSSSGALWDVESGTAKEPGRPGSLT